VPPAPQASSEPPGSLSRARFLSEAAERLNREPRPGVRVHVEETGQGVAVWLGMDGDQVAARVAALVADLRRQLQGSGQTLTSVICNGKVYYGDAEPAQPHGVDRVDPTSLHPQQQQEP
jgi:hypothetical protein